MPWPNRPNKYGNKTNLEPCSYGYKHKSGLELAVCNFYAWLEKGGEIKVIKHEEHLKFPCETCGESVIYWPDLTIQDLKTGEIYWVEAKGKEMDKWPKVRRAWRRIGPGRLLIYKGKWQAPKLVETLWSECIGKEQP